MAYKVNTAETGLADGTALTAANSGNGTAGNAFATVSAGTGGSIVVDTDRRAAGSSSYLLTPASGVTCYVIMTDTGGASFSAAFALFLDALPSSVGILCTVLGASTNSILQVNLQPSGALSLVDSSSTVLGSTTTTLTTGKWYCISISGTVGASASVRLDLYTGTATAGPASNATPTETLTKTGNTAVNSTAAGRFLVGKFTSGANLASFSLDNVQTNLTDATPLTPYSAAPVTVTGVMSATANTGQQRTLTLTLNNGNGLAVTWGPCDWGDGNAADAQVTTAAGVTTKTFTRTPSTAAATRTWSCPWSQA